jgi:hypothetical protein
MKPLISKIFIVLMAVLTGAFFIWLVQPSSVWPVGVKDALCTLELQEGSLNVTVSFKTSDTLERFFVFARPGKKGERLSITITGDNNFLCSLSSITESMRFSFSRGEIPPGTYTAVLKQETGSHGGQVIITDRQVGLRGWQILSRTFIVLLAIFGVWAALMHKSRHQRQRVKSVFIFHSLLMACTSMFLYLLFHEGGHALTSSLFGVFDWNRSDFFGIHGTPHAGRTSGTSIETWQQAVISFAGPMLPTLIGWVLFLFWRSRAGKRIRSTHTVVNLYLTAIVFMSVFPFIAAIGYILGITNDGDWQGFISNVPGPLWLVKTLVVLVLLVNIFILYRIVPEIWRVFKSLKADMENILRQPANKT